MLRASSLRPSGSQSSRFLKFWRRPHLAYPTAREIAHEGLSQLVVAETMHERKMKMASLADAFVALPGGLGTLEEILEAMTWTQLRLHEKACGFLNVDGYFDHLLEFIGHTVREGFVRPEHRSMLVVGANPATLLEKLAVTETPQVDKLM